MKLITSEMDAETDRWTEAQNAAQQHVASIPRNMEMGGNAGGPSGAAVNTTAISPTGGLDENNDIVKRARNMSSMAYSMYQFTRGEGTLKTTQALFTQAQYFAEEANIDFTKLFDNSAIKYVCNISTYLKMYQNLEKIAFSQNFQSFKML